MRPSHSAFSIWEVLILLVLLAVLAALAWPALTGSSCGLGGPISALVRMKQLHVTSMQMALDGASIGNSNLGWPGDTGGTFAPWASNLVAGGYLSTNDLTKLLAVPGPHPLPDRIPAANTNAILVYAIKATSPTNAVFLTSANFTNTPTGGLPPLPGSVPYGTKGFALFHQAGDGLILQQRQTGPAHTNLIGSFVPLCR